MHLLSAEWLSPVLKIVTIVVLVVTCWAAWAQAKAAGKLTKATEQQIEASKQLADSANTQNELARRQFEEGLRPFLTLVERLSGQLYSYAIRNDGAGPALGCFCFYGRIYSSAPKLVALLSEAIAPDQEVRFWINYQAARNEGLVLVCKSITGSPCAMEYTWISDHEWRGRYLLDVPEQVLAAAADLQILR